MLDIELIRTSIEENGFISHIYYFEELDSTNTIAAKKEIPVDSLVITSNQTSGKGRLDRKWESEKDMNLTFSIKKFLPLSPTEIHNAVYYFSYYVFDSILSEMQNSGSYFEKDKLFIKWPNDIMYENKKLSGILVESKLPSNVFVVGIGINCNQEVFSDSINAISLKEILGKKIDLNRFLIRLISNFSLNFSELLSSDHDTIFEKWKNSAKIIGKSCEINIDSGGISNGKIIDLNKDGSITIQTNSGSSKYHSGEIRISRFGQ